MKNQVIQCLNPEHGKDIIKYWQSRGIDTGAYRGAPREFGGNCFIYYGVINGIFAAYSLFKVQAANAEVINLPAKAEFQEREMMVSDDGKSWKRRVVFMEKCGRFIAWHAETIEEAANETGATYWELAKEIEQPKEEPIIEVTLEEIAKLRGVSVDKIRIKYDN